MDISKLMQTVQQMQSRLKEMQSEIESKKFEGQAAGGMVVATVNGRKQLISLQIENEILEEKDKQLLSDVIVAAVNQAQKKADEELKTSLSTATGGLPLPPDLMNML